MLLNIMSLARASPTNYCKSVEKAACTFLLVQWLSPCLAKTQEPRVLAVEGTSAERRGLIRKVAAPREPPASDASQFRVRGCRGSWSDWRTTLVIVKPEKVIVASPGLPFVAKYMRRRTTAHRRHGGRSSQITSARLPLQTSWSCRLPPSGSC